MEPSTEKQPGLIQPPPRFERVEAGLSDETPAPDPIPSKNQGRFLRLWRFRNTYLMAADVMLVFLSFTAAYYLRFYLLLDLVYPPTATEQIPALTPYLNIATLTSIIWVFLLYRDRAYGQGLHLSTSLPNQIIQVIQTGVYSLGLLMILSFMVRYFLLSRLVYLTSYILALSSLTLVRVIFHLTDRRIQKKCLILDRIVLLGEYHASQRLYDHLRRQNPCLGIIGRLDWQTSIEFEPREDRDLPRLGTALEIEAVYKRTPFDQVIIASQNGKGGVENGAFQYPLVTTLNFCEKQGLRLYMVPDVLDVTVTRHEVGSLAGLPLIGLRDSAIHPLYALAKRIMDFTLALLVLAAGLPLWLALALAIKLTSPGPVFYKEERVGLHGRPFIMYKFRSMVKDANDKLSDMVDFNRLEEPIFNIRRDPRVTAVGRFLRRTSLDEIPQLINVLLGSMSLIGPRPERSELVQMYNPFQRRRLKAKPGITGYQQVTSRGDPSLAKRIEYDLWYLKNQGFLLDVFILLKTILVVIRGDGME
ncbi:MAG: sugar transferase [Thermodesulfobacteriota bacterium]